MNGYIKKVCKIGQGAACCRYLVGGSEGLECAKFHPAIKAAMDRDWAVTAHVSQGDNCPGQENLQTAEVKNYLYGN